MNTLTFLCLSGGLVVGGLAFMGRLVWRISSGENPPRYEEYNYD
ncbi:hypothetical protein ACSFCT_24090 [Yokenella regensburgei]